MSKTASPYYPPRARWYGRAFYLGLATRHRLALDRIALPKEITLAGIAGGLLVPGLAVYLRGPRLWGRMALGACGLLFLLFTVRFGYPPGNYAFGLLLSIHASGFAYYCSPCLQDRGFWFRMGFTLAVLMALGFLLYAPVRSTIQHRWLMPLRINGHVVVIQRLHSASGVKRGDWVAYHLSSASQTFEWEDLRVTARAGAGLGPVLAVAGNRVAFSTNVFFVNGASQPLLPHMPTSGGLTVPENHWFIWPSYSITGQGNEGRISALMMQLADVSDQQFIGIPFKRWFWRKQIWQ